MQILAYILVLVAQYLISAAMRDKPKPPPPAAFEDFKFPQFQDGTPVAVIFGDVWIDDFMVLSVADYRYTPIEHSPDKK